MTIGPPADDDELMTALRRVAERVDPPPPVVLAAARAALSTRRLDAELAELVLDSHADAELAGAGVRAGPDAVRVLSFESAAVTVELQVRAVGSGAAVRGLVDGAAGPITLETRAERREVAVDDEGWFTIDAVPRGPARLVLTKPDGAATATSWTTL